MDVNSYIKGGSKNPLFDLKGVSLEIILRRLFLKALTFQFILQTMLGLSTNKARNSHSINLTWREMITFVINEQFPLPLKQLSPERREEVHKLFEDFNIVINTTVSESVQYSNQQNRQFRRLNNLRKKETGT